MHEDLKWFFGLIILFGVLWFASGGLNNKASSKNPFLEPVIQSGADSVNSNFAHIGNNSSDTAHYYGSLQNNQTAGKKLTTQEEIAQGLRDAGIKAAALKKELAALEETSHASPLTGKISVAGINRSSSADGEYIVLRASPQNSNKVLLTGLRLESASSGRGADIPSGVSLPFQNQINSQQPIYLAPGDIAYVITGRSPLGTSFRLNKCTGFFNQYQTFSPNLPSRCPQPSERDLPSNGTIYNDDCRNYINSLPSCRIVISPPVSISPECQRYVTQEISYTKCVDARKNDADFYDPEWRVYMGRDDILWKPSRELIHLLDSNGKIVDAVTY